MKRYCAVFLLVVLLSAGFGYVIQLVKAEPMARGVNVCGVEINAVSHRILHDMWGKNPQQISGWITSRFFFFRSLWRER